MRTRHSVRNQNRLFRELFEPTREQVTTAVTTCCFNCVNYPAHGRSRGACTLLGVIVNGRTERACFIVRQGA